MMARPTRVIGPVITGEPTAPFVTRIISHHGETYLASGAHGASVVSETPPGNDDHRAGRLAIVLWQDRPAGSDDDMPHGLAMVRAMTPDEADGFADALHAQAQAMRDHAGRLANEALLRATGAWPR